MCGPSIFTCGSLRGPHTKIDFHMRPSKQTCKEKYTIFAYRPPNTPAQENIHSLSTYSKKFKFPSVSPPGPICPLSPLLIIFSSLSLSLSLPWPPSLLSLSHLLLLWRRILLLLLRCDGSGGLGYGLVRGGGCDREQRAGWLRPGSWRRVRPGVVGWAAGEQEWRAQRWVRSGGRLPPPTRIRWRRPSHSRIRARRRRHDGGGSGWARRLWLRRPRAASSGGGGRLRRRAFLGLGLGSIYLFFIFYVWIFLLRAGGII